jgi:hypothetical protein
MDYPKDKIRHDKDYYSLSLLAEENNQIILHGQTMWVGWADEDRKIELREFTHVKAVPMADHWQKCEMPYCVVNDVDDFAKWYITGGHALVENDVATLLFPDSLKPSPSVVLGDLGFTGLRLLPKTIFRKAPTPKKRMAVLKRDKFKCKVCGRKPDNYVDIELNVHHIRPFSEGGFTHEENLITLCDTCHKGLDPHYEWSLFELLNNDTGTDLIKKEKLKYLSSVKRYREVRQQSAQLSGDH